MGVDLGWILKLGCQLLGGSWVDLGWILKRVWVQGVDLGWILKLGCYLEGGSWVDLETWMPIGWWILGGSRNLVDNWEVDLGWILKLVWGKGIYVIIICLYAYHHIQIHLHSRMFTTKFCTPGATVAPLAGPRKYEKTMVAACGAVLNWGHRNIKCHGVLAARLGCCTSF